MISQRKFRSQTSDSMDRSKSRGGKRQRGEKKREDKRREKVRREKTQVREKVGRSRFTAFFQSFVAREVRQVGSLKQRVRSHLAKWEMKNCTLLWREAHFKVKLFKAPIPSTVGIWHVQKVHAVVARSTFPSQNVQNTSPSDHFWKLRCQKSARCCGPKHICKSTCTKHTILGFVLEVEMSKKCTPLWREAHVKVKSVKNCLVRSTFGRSNILFPGRRRGFCTLPKVKKRWRFWSRFNYNRHFTTLHRTTLHYTSLRYTNYNYDYNYTTLHKVKLRCNYNCNYNNEYTTLQYSTLHSITLHSMTLHYTNYNCN